MKRIIYFIFSLLVLLSFAGCAQNENTSEKKVEIPPSINNEEAESNTNEELIESNLGIFPGFTYLPSGFSTEKMRLIESKDQQQQYFYNDDSRIVFAKALSSTTINLYDDAKLKDEQQGIVSGIDATLSIYSYDNDVRYTPQHGNDAIMVPSKDDIEVRWSDTDFQYHLFGNIEENELLSMAQSMTPNTDTE